MRTGTILVYRSGMAVLIAIGTLFAASSDYRTVQGKIIKGAFSVPSGWYFNEERGEGDAAAVFITKEKYGPKTIYQTGVSVNRVTDIRRKSGMTAIQFARKFIAVFKEQGDLVARSAVADEGKKPVWAQIRIKDKNGGAFRLHEVIVTKPEKDTAYIILFESPEQSWAENWAIGQPIVHQLEAGRFD